MPMTNSLKILSFLLGLSLFSTAAQADDREMVELPGHMQSHMLSNMRDHLRALEDIFAALSVGDALKAGAIAESRLGLSSLDDHGAAHMATFMPEAMQAMGTSMHKAASRFSKIAGDSDVEQTSEAHLKVFAALQDIVSACNACHAGYRIR